VAQESIFINKLLLKHLRIRKDKTQADIAEHCDVSHRQYQNIEKNGRTTLRVIQSLAQYLEISIDTLTTNKREDDSYWYVTNPYVLVGNIQQGFCKTIDDIKNTAKRRTDAIPSRLSIKNEREFKEITLNVAGDEYCWNMRPILIDKNIGLLWAELTEWQKEIWEQSLKELLYGCVNDVYIDDKPLVPVNRKLLFIVHFKEASHNKAIYKGYRLFNSNAVFRVALSDWLDNYNPIIPPNRSDLGSLNITYDFAGEVSKSISIYRVWLDENGKKHKAPWPNHNINEVLKAITETKNGKRIWAIPIGIDETLGNQNIPPMTPEVICNEVLEIPEFNFTPLVQRRTLND
tara:strand:+ start:35532 stop:36569 length:1038 start_codon:yes stop_codon:yes gene_type:complete